MQDRPHEYRLWIAIIMTPAEEAAYRSEHAMAGGEGTRKQLATTVSAELEGLGETSGWWSEVRVR